MDFISELSRAVMLAHGADSFDLMLQDGPNSGQSVPHFHMHLLPRVPGDLRQTEWFVEVWKTSPEREASDSVQQVEHDRPAWTVEQREEEAKNVRECLERIRMESS